MTTDYDMPQGQSAITDIHAAIMGLHADHDSWSARKTTVSKYRLNKAKVRGILAEVKSVATMRALAEASKQSADRPKERRGRPKGAKNRPRTLEDRYLHIHENGYVLIIPGPDQFSILRLKDWRQQRVVERGSGIGKHFAGLITRFGPGAVTFARKRTNNVRWEPSPLDQIYGIDSRPGFGITKVRSEYKTLSSVNWPVGKPTDPVYTITTIPDDCKSVLQDYALHKRDMELAIHNYQTSLHQLTSLLMPVNLPEKAAPQTLTRIMPRWNAFAAHVIFGEHALIVSQRPYLKYHKGKSSNDLFAYIGKAELTEDVWYVLPQAKRHYILQNIGQRCRSPVEIDIVGRARSFHDGRDHFEIPLGKLDKHLPADKIEAHKGLMKIRAEQVLVTQPDEEVCVSVNLDAAPYKGDTPYNRPCIDGTMPPTRKAYDENGDDIE